MKKLVFFGILLSAIAVAGVTYALPGGVANTSTVKGFKTDR